jgi:sarcosine oxidase
VFDVIIAGLGAMGSAAAFHLARRGLRVLGLERFTHPHAFGSSHGKSRIIREAYFENPLYVPLVQRAYQCWAELESRSGRRLLTPTGGLMIGPRDGVVVRGARASAVEHGLPFEELSAAEVHERFPSLLPAPSDVAIWEPRAGILDPESAIEAHLALARENGAQLRFGEPVESWTERAGGLVRVRTAQASYDAAWLVIASGAWVAQLVPELALPVVVERNVVHWFHPSTDSAHFGLGSLPIFIHEHDPGRVWYGFPDLGDGVKLALHHQGEPTTAESVRRAVSRDEVERVRALADRFLPGAAGRVRESVVCLYTNSPDEHFILDTHPGHHRVVVASPCSGHGFKFSSAIGEAIADLVLDGRSRFDLAPFRLSRFR